jgi:uncharacterized membrane protein
MNKIRRSLIKILHLLFACFWLGASASIVLLQCVKGWSVDGQQLAALNRNFSVLDFALIIPGALGSLVTGYLICRTTSWGFTRYRWVVMKWILTITAVLIGTALLGPWQMQMVKLSGQPGSLLVTSTLYHSYDLIRFLFTLVGSLQVLLLLSLIAISVRKPWGKCLLKQKEIRTLEHRTEVIRSVLNE